MRKILLITVLSILLTFIPLSFAWLHHQFITGLNPFLGVGFELLALIIAILLCILLFKIFKKYISFTPDVFFVIGLFSFITFICLLEIFYGNYSLDIHLQDTYFVMPYSFELPFISIVFATFAAIYYWFPKIFKSRMNNALGYIHFGVTSFSICLLVLPEQYTEFASMPRRYYDYENWNAYNEFTESNKFILIPVILLFIAQLLFVFNFCYSIYKAKKANANHL